MHWRGGKLWSKLWSKHVYKFILNWITNVEWLHTYICIDSYWRFSFHNFITVTSFYLFVFKCVSHIRFIAGPIDLKTAYALYEDLKTAQKHLILIDNLHLLYLVTPYDSISQITPIGSIYYDVVILFIFLYIDITSINMSYIL